MKDKRKRWGFVVVGAVAAVTLGVIAVASAATTQKASPSPSASARADGRNGDQAPAPDFDGDGPHGFDGDCARGGRGGFGHGFGGGGDLGQALAELSGKDEATIQSQRAAGKSYAEIAKSYGVGTGELVDETVRIEKAELDAAVKAGTLTDAQRTEILSGLRTHLGEEISETHALGGHGSGPDDGDTRVPGTPASPSASGTTQSF